MSTASSLTRKKHSQTKGSTQRHRSGGSMSLEFYAPLNCTKKCSLRQNIPMRISDDSNLFEDRGILESIVLLWSHRQLFAIDTAMHELIMGSTYIKMRRRRILLPVYANLRRSKLRLAHRVAQHTANIFKTRRYGSPTSHERRCATRWQLWATCLANVLNLMLRKRWSRVCVGLV